MGDGTYSIEELEEILGVKARTLHSWTTAGLVEGPGAGRGARYTDEHLAKLFLIQKLRAEGRPLAEIRASVKRLSASAVNALAEQARTQPPKAPAKAKELINRWLGAAGEDDAPSMRLQAREPRAVYSRVWSSPAPAQQWERVPLAPDVELHVRRPLSPTSRTLVDAILAAAQRQDKEDSR